MHSINFSVGSTFALKKNEACYLYVTTYHMCMAQKKWETYQWKETTALNFCL